MRLQLPRTMNRVQAAGNVALDVRRELASLAGKTLAGWWPGRPLRVAAMWGIVAWVILEATFLAWVHYNAEGVSHRAFLPGVKFKIPVREAAAGMQDVCASGHDGQQYYWMSNDVFGRNDAYLHLDNVLYRYQRIGIPMLAGGLSTLLGFELTPPLLYHTLQFGLTAAGFGALVYWLLIQGLNPAYALGWLLAGGTLQSLWLGLLDAPADAFFVFTLLAVLAGRLWWYVPLATLLVLTREGYVVYAFAIFAMTVLSRCAWRDSVGPWKPLVRFEWRDVAGYWKPVALTALPGIVMLAWTAYLAIHFQMSPIDARRGPDPTNWPYYMMVRYHKIFFREGNWFELRLLAVSAFTLVVVSVLMARNFRRLPLALACAAPYVLLTAALGKMVWENSGGHMKACGSIVVIGLFLLPFDKSLVLRIMLALQAIAGLDLQADVRLMHQRILSPYLVHEEGGYPENPPGAPDNPLLSDLRSSVEWVRPESVCRREYQGLWSRVHREIKPVTVAVTNRGDVTWQPGRGKHPLWLGYTLYEGTGNRQLAQHSVILDKAIAPGETQELTAYVELLRPGRKYVVEFSMWQEGPGWFVRTDPDFGRRYEFTVE